MHQEGILGVLGGMGPQATNTFYQRIIDRTQAESDQEHLRVLIWSDAKIPDRTAGILGTPDQAEAVYQHLLADAKLLERAGCTVLAIPCNTSHFFADRLQKELEAPLIHMPRETVAVLARSGRRCPPFGPWGKPPWASWPPTAPSGRGFTSRRWRPPASPR